MTAPAAAPAHGRITWIGLALLAGLAALVAWSPPRLMRAQSLGFDAYQRLLPRAVTSTPATVVAIDEASLARHGQWPWPRTLLADLVAAIARHGPAAIGVDILMPEPDRLSPDRLLDAARLSDAALAERLAALPSNDSVLARAIAAAPVVLPLAGTPEPAGDEPRAPPILVVDRARDSAATHTVAASVPRFAGSVASIAELDRAAAGHGAISIAPADVVVRRAPLLVRVGDRLVPSFALEMVRVALAAPDVRVYARGADVDAVAVGAFAARTEADGQIRVHFSPRDPRRIVSAAAVLDGTVDPARLARKLVVVGVTGLALADYAATPLTDRMPGSEVHAQLLENLYDRSWLTRPHWAPWLEAAVLVLLGLVLVYATPRWAPGHATLLAAACVAAPLAAGMAAFAWRGFVFDAAGPAIALLLLFGVLLALTLSEAWRQRRALEATVRVQRERAAFVAGELEAAKRIQLGFLPRADALASDPRVEVAAAMTPAREVGGDLYDYFLLDADRLFFLVGDVAGKGLSASLFMAVGKALVKSVALRAPRATVGELLQAANAEIARDNAEMFFITAFAGVVHLDAGVLDYCNAGHDDPVLLRSADGTCARLDGGAGPPLCTVDGFAYCAGQRRLQAGDVVCVVTDGVVDAQDPHGTRYGSARLSALLARLARPGVSAGGVVAAVGDDVRAFAAGAEPADDLTILALRWNGPHGPGR